MAEGEENRRKISGHCKQRTMAVMLTGLVLGTGHAAGTQSRDKFSYWKETLSPLVRNTG